MATGPASDWLLGVLPPAVIELVWNLLVLALATVLFYLYGRVEIIDGLRAGERVAVKGTEFLADGLLAVEAEDGG